LGVQPVPLIGCLYGHRLKIQGNAMTTFEPAKRKAPPIANRRFHTGLLLWIMLSILARAYPLIWLAPPYEKLTPMIYILVSVMWIPFAVQHVERYGLPLSSIPLMAAGCGYTLLFLHYFLHPSYAYYDGTGLLDAFYARLYPWGYVAMSLAWVPFAVRFARSYHLPRRTILLIAGGILSTGLFLSAGDYIIYLTDDYQLARVDAMLNSPIVQYAGYSTWYLIELTGLTGLPIAVLTKLEFCSCCTLI
jgi:hypothetical protein